MDQYVASPSGRPGSAIEIDCRSLTHQVVGLPAQCGDHRREFDGEATDPAQSAYREANRAVRGGQVEAIRDALPPRLEACATRI